MSVVGGIGGAGLLASPFCVGTWSKNLCLCLSPLSFSLGRAGEGAGLDRELQSCSVRDGLLGEQPRGSPAAHICFCLLPYHSFLGKRKHCPI